MGGDRHRLRAFGSHPIPTEPLATISPAPGNKCARCWRVLTEVGQQPGASRRCASAAPTRSSRDWFVARDGTAPSPNPLPQGEGECPHSNRSPCGRGLGEGAAPIDPQPPDPARPCRRHRRAGRRPGQQVVGARRAPPAGHRPDRAAAGAEPHHGVEPRRHLRTADRLRPVELPAARRRRARGRRRPGRLAAPRRVAAGRHRAWRHRGRRAQQRHRPAALRRGGGLHPRPCRRHGPGMCSTSPTPRSFAAWRRWCSTACCRARGGADSTG